MLHQDRWLLSCCGSNFDFKLFPLFNETPPYIIYLVSHDISCILSLFGSTYLHSFTYQVFVLEILGLYADFFQKICNFSFDLLAVGYVG
jgi:hypothetical protein